MVGHSLASRATALQLALPKVAVHGDIESRHAAGDAVWCLVLVLHKEVLSKVFPSLLPAFLFRVVWCNRNVLHLGGRCVEA